MRQYPILMVAVDFPEHAAAALKYAHNLARRLDGTIILVNVFNERDIQAIQHALETYDPALYQKYIDDSILGSCAQKMFRRCPVPLLSLRTEIR